jgi:hypothetical protein
MRWIALPVLVVAACGGDDSPATPDAPVEIDASSIPAGCDYLEQQDATNDDVPPATGSPEMTGVTLGARNILCGTFDSTHFDGDITVDIDGFVVTVPTDRDVLVRIHGTGAEAIELVGVDVYTGADLTTFVGSSTFYGDHGVASLHLAAGTYELVAISLNGTAIASPVAYRIELDTDTPARCPEITTGGFAEASDGVMSTGNDMVRIPSGMPPSLTPTADNPEPSGLTLAPAASSRVTGSAADVTLADQYEDKDTFAFMTGAGTNELTVRLTWPGAAANLDFLLFEAGNPAPVIRAITAANQSPELRTFSVKPGTSYWLLVGAKAGSTGFPIAYTASMCGVGFTP